MMQILILMPHDEHQSAKSPEKSKSAETSNSCVSQRGPKHPTALPSILQRLGAERGTGENSEKVKILCYINIAIVPSKQRPAGDTA